MSDPHTYTIRLSRGGIEWLQRLLSSDVRMSLSAAASRPISTGNWLLRAEKSRVLARELLSVMEATDDTRTAIQICVACGKPAVGTCELAPPPPPNTEGR